MKLQQQHCNFIAVSLQFHCKFIAVLQFAVHLISYTIVCFMWLHFVQSVIYFQSSNQSEMVYSLDIFFMRYEYNVHILSCLGEPLLRSQQRPVGPRFEPIQAGPVAGLNPLSRVLISRFLFCLDYNVIEYRRLHHNNAGIRHLCT